MSHRWSLRAAVGTALLATATTGTVVAPTAGSAATTAPSPRVLQLTFNDDNLTSKTPHFVNAGSANLSVSLVSKAGGALRSAKGRLSPATNTAVRTPAFAPGANGPRAVIKVVDRTGTDALNPGTGAFTFGADFARNAASERAGTSDNGDNLMQRGLFGHRSQYKLQLDHGRATCRVKGAAGAVAVSSPVAITAGRWYRLRCTRSGSTVTLSVSRWSAKGVATTSTSSVKGPTGDLSPTSATMPLSIGGKLDAAGGILVDTDQFNGRIDNVLLQIP
jgi:hypothetical protein